MAVGYKIYLHTNTDQPEQHENKMKSIRKIYLWREIKHIKQNIDMIEYNQ
jgi:hypothetical protein